MKKKGLCRQLAMLFLLGFLLGIHEGRVAIWKDGSEKPWRVLPYPSLVLPAETQAKLRRGIRIDTMEDLDALLENLLS